MWPTGSARRVVRDDLDRFVIAPHHPDRLRRPAPSPGAAFDDRFHQALLWNTFRTLELIAPSFWLRRFHLRLTGEPSLVSPQIARVHLWLPLPLPPIQRIDGGRPDVVADVVIETEHAVWTLVAESRRREVTDGEAIAAIVDAGDWFAGARQHHCGVIEPVADARSAGSLLQARYSRSRDSTRLRSATRGPTGPADVRWGTIGWPELAALLEDCCDAAALLPIDRVLAGNAREWLISMGIDLPPSARQSG